MVLLPVIIVGVGLVWTPVSFLPYGDDTYANWLTTLSRYGWSTISGSRHDVGSIGVPTGVAPVIGS